MPCIVTNSLLPLVDKEMRDGCEFSIDDVGVQGCLDGDGWDVVGGGHGNVSK